MRHLRQWTNEDPHSPDSCDVKQGTWCHDCGCCHHCRHNDCDCKKCGCWSSVLAEILTLTTAEDET